MRVGMIITTALALAACASKSEQLYQKRDAAKALGESIYRQFGDGPVAGELDKAGAGAAREGHADRGGLLQAMGQFARAVDEVSVKEDCLKLGRGQEVVLLSDKAKAFFGRDDVKKGCRRLAVLKDEIRALERELGQPVTED